MKLVNFINNTIDKLYNDLEEVIQILVDDQKKVGFNKNRKLHRQKGDIINSLFSVQTPLIMMYIKEEPKKQQEKENNKIIKNFLNNVLNEEDIINEFLINLDKEETKKEDDQTTEAPTDTTETTEDEEDIIINEVNEQNDNIIINNDNEIINERNIKLFSDRSYYYIFSRESHKTVFLKRLKPNKEASINESILYIISCKTTNFKFYDINNILYESNEYSILKRMFYRKYQEVDLNELRNNYFINHVNKAVINYEHLFFKNDNYNALKIAYQLNNYIQSLTSSYILRKIEQNDTSIKTIYNEYLIKLKQYYKDNETFINNNIDVIKLTLGEHNSINNLYDLLRAEILDI